MSVNKAFYQIAKDVTANDLAQLIGAKVLGGDSTSVEKTIIKDIVSFSAAAPSTLVFQSDTKLLASHKVQGAIIITNEIGAAEFGRKNICLIVQSPRLGFARALSFLISKPDFGPCSSGISPHALVSPDAVIHPSATIMAGVSIGAGTVIEAGAIVHPSVKVGEHCHIGSNVVLSYAILGNHVQIGSGSIVGEAGFGFEMTEDGAVRIPHIGLVELDDYVSIGSACAIDRGTLGNTRIGSNVMVDNLCHIAHNVTIGSKSIIAGQCGISGSATVGAEVVMGGQVGIAPQVSIGNGAVLFARSGVTKDVCAGEQVAGFPAISSRQFWRNQAAIRRLSKTKSFDRKKP